MCQGLPLSSWPFAVGASTTQTLLKAGGGEAAAHIYKPAGGAGPCASACD